MPLKIKSVKKADGAVVRLHIIQSRACSLLKMQLNSSFIISYQCLNLTTCLSLLNISLNFPYIIISNIPYVYPF